MATQHEKSRKLIRSYIIGLVLSAAFTVIAYLLATKAASMNVHNTPILIPGVLGVLALGQFITQLIYFLHMRDERAPNWRAWIFYLMIFLVLIVVIGSVWIMQNLNYNMMDMSSSETKVYMRENEGF